MRVRTESAPTRFPAPAVDPAPTLIETLPLSAVQVGDIVATYSDAFTSRSIRWATNEPFSHAILCLKNNLAVDATPEEGVRVRSLGRTLLGVRRAVVFRHRHATLDQKALAANWAAAQQGRPYDFTGAARVGLRPGARTFPMQFTGPGMLITYRDESASRSSEDGHDASFFCSELIFRAYEVAHAPIVRSRPHLTGPGALVLVDTVEHVGELRLSHRETYG